MNRKCFAQRVAQRQKSLPWSALQLGTLTVSPGPGSPSCCSRVVALGHLLALGVSTPRGRMQTLVATGTLARVPPLPTWLTL